MRRWATCTPSAAPSNTKPPPISPASRWRPAATSIWPSSAIAELLCEHVDAFGLAARAKEAVARRVHEMSFGTRAECEGYMQRVQKAQAAVANQKQITGAVKAKLERLRASCEYRNNADTVPTADSLAPPSAGQWTRARPRGAAARVERAGRGLLGPVHAAAALGRSRRASAACRCAAPASGARAMRRRAPRDPRRSARPHPAGCRQPRRP